jgi:FKBP-type peptidyl-prolyl cis-trans isomerase SlyD
MSTQRVIGFHYTVQDEDGEELDSSHGDEPLYILEGAQQVVPGLERQVVTMKVGEKRTVAVKAAEAYGTHDPNLVLRVEKSQFPPDTELDVGDQFAVDEDEESPVFTVVSVEPDAYMVDGNHPLAGHDLVFDVEIVEVRAATPEELSHGHAHGAHGHHH